MPVPRRILMTADTVGGVWTYAVELARGLAGHGVETVIASMGGAPSPSQRAAAAGLTVVESGWRLEWMAGCEADLDRAGAWLLGLEERFRPDAVHVNGFAQASLPWRAPCVLVAHSCVVSWWRAVWGTEPPAEWNAYRQRVAAGLRAADRVVALTEAFCREIEAIYGPLPHARVVHNGRRARDFAPGAKEPFVLAAGRVWDEAKNVPALARAAARIAWPVVVAGGRRAPDGRQADLPGARCLGALGGVEMARWMARAAIFAAPARYEPFGLGVLEAALSGCALVLGDIAPLRELWDGTAVFVPPDDDAALAEAIEALIADERRRAALARAARTRAAAYSAERMVDGYLDLYANLPGSAGVPPALSPSRFARMPARGRRSQG